MVLCSFADRSAESAQWPLFPQRTSIVILEFAHENPAVDDSRAHGWSRVSAIVLLAVECMKRSTSKEFSLATL